MMSSYSIKRGNLRTATAAGLVLGMIAFVPVAHGDDVTASENQSSISIAVKDGLVSVVARDAALANLLQAIAEKANFKLSIAGDIEQTLTWSFTDIPLDLVVHELTRDVSSVMIYSPDGETLLEVHVFPSGDEAYGGTTEIAPASHPEPYVVTSVEYEAQLERRREARNLILKPNAVDVEEIANFVSEDPDPAIRAMAVMGLGRFRNDAAKEHLVEAMYDDDSHVRSEAIQVLGHLWRGDAVEQLRKVASAHVDPETRGRAAMMLKTIQAIESQESVTTAE